MNGQGALPFSFEVKDTDLLGRVGVLRVGDRILETPCLLPVIHPVNQAVTTGELKTMGFQGLMTNSYIIWSRRKEEATERGIHDMLGFDGMLMTDSGGYQVLEYGDLNVGYKEIAAFQASIGSDLAVTLDRPTGYPQSRGAARESVEYSLTNATATIREYADSDTTWVGPIQGGLYLDLVRKSAASLCKAGFGFVALGSPVQVMENYMFAELVKMIVAVKKAIPYSIPLHLFGAGHPLTMALAVALGCDTFDSASYILFARHGRYMSHAGVLSLDAMKYLPCSCAVCARTNLKDLREADSSERTKMIATHNLYMLKEEIENCKEAIAEGRLWDLVEEKSMAHPRLHEAFVELSKHGDLLSEGTPLLKDKGLMFRSIQDLKRPELSSATKKLRSAMRRSSDNAIVYSSWDSLPIGKKRLHATNSLDMPNVYRIHPALGLYPAELDFIYPFTQVVAAEGMHNRMSAREISLRLRKLGYTSVKVSRYEEAENPLHWVKSRRIRRGAFPSLRSSSARPRSPRRL